MFNPLDVSLKLHTDPDGVVWYLEGQGIPVCSGVDVDTFLVTNRPQESMLVHIIGTHQNVNLILELHLLRHDDPNFRLYVCTPALCHTEAERRDPEIALIRARRYMLPGSLGGWHRFGYNDYPVYALAYLIDTEADPSVDHLSQLLGSHVIWPALSFANVDEVACAKLVAQILDPRWFIDLQHPDRTSRLESYLGLRLRDGVHTRSDGNHATSDDGNCLPDPRSRAVVNCWLPSLEETLDTDRGLKYPENFLYRIWVHHALDGPVKAQLRVSQAFVRFLRHVWLDALYKGGDGLFAPEHFFKHEYEVEGFKEHMSSFKV